MMATPDSRFVWDRFRLIKDGAKWTHQLPR